MLKIMSIPKTTHGQTIDRTSGSRSGSEGISSGCSHSDTAHTHAHAHVHAHVHGVHGVNGIDIDMIQVHGSSSGSGVDSVDSIDVDTHVHHAHFQVLGGPQLAGLLLQGLQGLSDNILITESTALDTTSSGFTETDAMGFEDHSARILFIGQLQVSCHSILTSESTLAHNAGMGLLGQVTLHVAISVMDARKCLGALIASMRTLGFVCQAVALEVEWPGEGAMAVGVMAHIASLGLLDHAIGRAVAAAVTQ